MPVDAVERWAPSPSAWTEMPLRRSFGVPLTQVQRSATQPREQRCRGLSPNTPRLRPRRRLNRSSHPTIPSSKTRRVSGIDT